MTLKDIVHFNRLEKTFLIFTVIFALISMAFGALLAARNSAALQSMIESKRKAMARFLEETSITPFLHNDLSALENDVKGALRDGDVAFIVYYDAEKKPLTRTSAEPDNTASMVIEEREIRTREENSKLLGYLKVGYRQKAPAMEFQSILTTVIGALLFLSLLSLGAMGLAGGLTRALRNLADVIEKIPEGSFTTSVRPDMEQRADEVGTLARSLSKMSARLKGVIKKIQGSSHQISLIIEKASAGAEGIRAGAADQTSVAAKASASVEEMNLSVNKISESIVRLSSTSQETAHSLGEMSAAVRQASDDTAALSESVKDTTTSLSGMSGTIKEVAEHIDTLLLYAEEASASVSEMNASIEEVEKNAKESALLAEKGSQEAAELGIGAIEQTIDGMEQIKKSVEKSSYIIHKLDDRAKKIGNILTVIDGVTRQTNMLALNASILAAQAGNEGKGFAVVSDEMKSLADRTEISTTEIAQLIRDVQSDTTDAVHSVKEGLQSVEEGVRRSAHAKDSLTKIMEISERSSVMSRQIENATMEQVNATNKMTRLMEKVSVMVMKINTAMSELENGTFNISQASQKMNSITEQVRANLEDQAKGSARINDLGEEMRVQIQEIAAALGDQKKGGELITKSILEIQEITQASVRMAQEINQAMEGLSRQTIQIKNEVDHFSI